MSKHKLGVLGYVSPEGTSRSALAGIAVTPDLEIISDAVSSSRKYENLLANPAASFVAGAGEGRYRVFRHHASLDSLQDFDKRPPFIAEFRF